MSNDIGLFFALLSLLSVPCPEVPFVYKRLFDSMTMALALRIHK